jgi:hypothetical protein
MLARMAIDNGTEERGQGLIIFHQEGLYLDYDLLGHHISPSLFNICDALEYYFILHFLATAEYGIRDKQKNKIYEKIIFTVQSEAFDFAFRMPRNFICQLN